MWVAKRGALWFVVAMTGATDLNQGMDAASYRTVMRHQAGAVTVIAAGLEGRRAGITATAFASLSDSPPTILACVHLETGAHGAIVREKAFSVNLLANDQQEVAERFAGKRSLRGEARFAGLEWVSLATGAPILANALACLDCELLDRHASTTHSIFIGRVVAGRFRPEAQPLLYFRNDYWDLSED
jgi:flavin reductase (DIM6/NTAB) family NADH-FMN oxidoreductase RutF